MTRKQFLGLVPLMLGGLVPQVHARELASQSAASMAEVIALRSEFRIRIGKRSDFQKLAGEMFDIVRTKETQTLLYGWYVREDGNTIAAVESYADSAALLAHFDNVGPFIPRLMSLVNIHSNAIYGDPNQAALAAIASFRWFQVVPPQRFRFFGGASHA